MRKRILLRLSVGVFGVALFTHLVRQMGPAKLLESVTSLGWGLGLVIALGGVSHLVKAWAWRLTLLDEKRHVSFMRVLGLRLGSEAAGQLGFSGQVLGETLRVSLLSSNIPLASGITSVTLDRAFFVLSGMVVSAAGIIAVLIALPLPHRLSSYAALLAAVLLGILFASAIAVGRRWPVLSGTARVLSRVPYLDAWIERERSLIYSVENKLLDFHRVAPRAFWGSFALNLVCHGAAVFEVYLILWLMGVKVSLFAALAVEALTKVVNTVGTFNPGNLGTYEGGNILIAKMFGMSAAAGLTLSLTRRCRSIFWAVIGGVWLAILSISRKRRYADKSDLVALSPVAVVFANNLDRNKENGALLPRVGALPVLLRAILGAQKAGAARIVVVLNETTGLLVQRALLRTRRLPASIEWFQVGSGSASLPSLFGQFAREEEPLVLISGDRTYHPALHRRAGEWKGEGDALVLMARVQSVGICVISRDVAVDFATHGSSHIASLDELLAWLTMTHSVEYELVPEDKWQRIRTPQDIQSAEHKLDRWLVKPTDGIFARMNRRVSIPISRAIIRFPITPNMVSLFTLGVSFLAGLCFAFGGYWNMLLGAILSVFASILDGCDGEVARLKLQESDFGCWLETICDYLYYLFIFAGMTIGLARTSGSSAYLTWGGLLVFGAIVAFLVTGMGRHRLTNGRPEQLLGIWQARAERQQSNWLLFIGRHTEFIIRRCFLPYAFLFFAVFNLTKVAFILSAVGANLVWIIALYSYRAFSASPTRALASPATSG